MIGLAQQSPSPAAPDKDAVAVLRQYLRDTASAGPTSFDVRWQPASSPATVARGLGKPEVEAAKGSFGPDWLLVELQSGKQPEWLQVGRHTVTRAKGEAWQFAGPRQVRVEGTDPPLLLRALAVNTSAVAARSITERDGVPVEQFTVCLDQAQAETLVTSGAMFDPSPLHAVARSLVKSGRADAKDVPIPVVDACFDVDVATHQVKRVHVRAMCKEVDMNQFLRGAVRRPAAAEGQNAEAEAGSAPATPAAPATPKEVKDGLPLRDENGMQVVWLEVVMRDHGKAPAVVLDAAQKALFGR